MKKIVPIFLALFFTLQFSLSGQNLVQNPGFEINTGMPSAYGQYYLANNWSNANSTTSTPDYLHVNGVGNLQIPNTVFGTVNAYQGNAVMGFCSFHSNFDDFREYLTQQLSTPLIVGNTYTFSFYYTNGIPGILGGMGTPNLQVDFSVNPINQISSTPLGYAPLLSSSTMNYSNSWVQISYTFTANEPYAYFAIGNFSNDVNTITQQFVVTSTPSVYCFLDEISLTLTSNNNFNVIGAANVCFGDSTLLEAFNSTIYAWADSLNPALILGSDSTLLVAPTVTTTYFVYGADDTLSVTVDVFNPTTFSLGNDTTLCDGEILDINPQIASGSFLWQDNSTNPTFAVSQPGTYWLNFNLNNCSSIDTLIVDYNPTPVIDLGNDTALCFGESLILDAQTPNATYLWSNNSTSANITVANQGTYWVNVSLNNCSAVDTFLLNIYTPVPFDLGNDTTLCDGEILMLDAQVSNGIYLWQNNSTNSTFQVSQPGTYWLNLTANNCNSTDTLIVYYNSVPLVNLGSDTALCIGESLFLNAQNPNATYLWSDNSTSPNITVVNQGTYWVNVTLNNCSATDTLILSINTPIAFDLGNDTTLCDGDVLLLDPQISNGTFLWQDNSTNPTFPVAQPGTYWLNLSTNNCISSDTLIVAYNPVPAINLGADTTLCSGESLILNAQTSNATYLWSNNSTNATITAFDQGVYWVNVTVNNCSAADSLLLNIKAQANIDLGKDTILCAGETLLLNSQTQNASYLWNDNSTSETFNVSQTGIYWVMVTANNCTAIDSIDVKYDQTSVINLGSDTSVCIGETLSLNVPISNATYLWQDGTLNQNYNVTTSGIYWVIVTNNNCVGTDTIQIESINCEIVLEMPNVLSPNNDGLNDNFYPIKMDGINEATLEIYNRWGQKLAETNNLGSGWDGKNEGKECIPGTYFWILRYTTIANETKSITGFLTLLK